MMARQCVTCPNMALVKVIGVIVVLAMVCKPYLAKSEDTLPQQGYGTNPVEVTDIFVPLPDEPSVLAVVSESSVPDAAPSALLQLNLPQEPDVSQDSVNGLAGLDVAVPSAPAQPAMPTPAISAETVMGQKLAARLGSAANNAQRKLREGIEAAYVARSNKFLWVENEAWTPAALAARGRLELATEDGLDLKTPVLPSLPSARKSDQTALMEKIAEADLAMSDAVVAYARLASGGQVDPQRISHLITAKPEPAEPADILAKVAAAATDAGNVLQGFNPQHKGYRDLRAKLAELRQVRMPVVAEKTPLNSSSLSGSVLRLGMKDPRVPLIRAHFGLAESQLPEGSTGASTVYDTRVADAVAGFQRTQGLPASGVLTARTISALSGGVPSRLENDLLANMEMWRWLPRDMGRDRIEVNIPDYEVRVVEGGDIVHRARVVVGKPTTPTPVFSDTMRFLIVNPYWNVPPSIIKKEMMPRLAADPDYLRRMGYEVLSHRGRLIVRQPPGERNALGRIKFMFPNDHAVYLHDTPSRALFANEKRAYSHGCVRVDQPFRLAEVVLGRQNGWSEERVRRMIGGAERTIPLPKPLPIHIEYFTVHVGSDGQLALKEDIYGYTQRVKAALRLE